MGIGRKSKLWPALTVVSCATTIMDLEHVGPLSVCSENGFAGKFFGRNLIGHLTVLVVVHIFTHCCRPCIEGKIFKTVNPLEVSAVFINLLKGEHMLGNGTKLCALNGTYSGETLVAGISAIHRTVIFVKDRVEIFGIIGVFFSEFIAGNSFSFDCLGNINNVSVIAPHIKRSFPLPG